MSSNIDLQAELADLKQTPLKEPVVEPACKEPEMKTPKTEVVFDEPRQMLIPPPQMLDLEKPKASKQIEPIAQKSLRESTASCPHPLYTSNWFKSTLEHHGLI